MATHIELHNIDELDVVKLRKIVAKYNDDAVTTQERDTIFAFLSKYATKYKVRVEHLINYIDKSRKRRRFFTYSTLIERDLFMHLVLFLHGQNIDITKKSKQSRTFVMYLSDFEYVELHALYDFHKNHLAQEYAKLKQSLVPAYIIKNKLYRAVKSKQSTLHDSFDSANAAKLSEIISEYKLTQTHIEHNT